MGADAYRQFLEAKIPVAQRQGLACSLDEVATHLVDGRALRDHQRHVIRWAVEGGRRALFEAFGLGKTIQQIEVLRIILDKLHAQDGYRSDGLIVAPLGVRREFMHDAQLLGVELRFVRSDAEIQALHADGYAGLFLTNYESVRDGKITVSRFVAVSLDEASVLRSYGSDTFQTFLPLFQAVPYRFVATATPSPNRYKELIHYGGFLGVMDTGQALTRFFQRNSEKAGDLTLYPHKEEEFFAWLNSWAVFLQRPSDLGFSDEGYELPPLTVRWHVVQSDLADGGVDSRGQGKLMRDAALSLQAAAKEKRTTLGARVAKAAGIVAAAPADHFILWHDLEDERRAIEASLPEAESVYGTQPLDKREGIIERFAEGMSRLLAAKPVMLGSGTNLQRHCHRAIFCGVGFKFNDFIQAIHRLQRFQQPHPVEIDIIHAETETEVVRVLQEKWARHEELAERMSALIRKYGLQHEVAIAGLQRSIGVDRQVESGEGWSLAHNDCVLEADHLEENSVGLIVTSIPFSNHYEYTPSYNDLGHTDDDAHFFAQLDFLTPKLLRALRPGRLMCVHVKDRILFGSVTGEGVPTVNPFHAKCIFHYAAHGFQFLGMHHVDTDVVRENNQTYRLSYSEMLKDATKMGCGSPEYVLLFRKPQSDKSRAYADDPVAKDPAAYSLARWQIDAHAHWRSSGNRLALPEELAQLPDDLAAHVDRFTSMQVGSLVKAFREESRHLVYDYDAHVAIGETIEARAGSDGRGKLPRTFMALAPGASGPGIWDDIVRMRTLNAEQARKGAEKHVCPLQFDIVDRLIDFYSMPGDLVFDPFAGLGTVPMRAIQMGRRGAGSELNPDYFRFACQYLRDAEAEASVPSLFDLMGLERAA
ncbi:DNA methyltransferase [Sphingomonas azotifigens]|uniref:DNA methyltransferase n=1 Tax=Sphingomonas azotifigens TaxID=330920 RepID=UPI0009FFF41E|nr:DNA methyltransferase [Sphingomonas azotifigens]